MLHRLRPLLSAALPSSFTALPLVIPSLSSAQLAAFRADGFLAIPGVLQPDLTAKLRERLELLFAGQYATGVYPDEIHWREGLSLPLVTRELCNAWKSDPVVASVVLSPSLGRLSCELLGWPAGARVAQDDVFHKPQGGGTPVAFHRDSTYISDQFSPRDDVSLTCWLALDDVDDENGALQYVPGSHRWPRAPAGVGEDFHNPSHDHLESARREAEFAGEKLSVVSVPIGEGGLVVHHQDVLHGSGANVSPDRPRRSLAVHTLRADVQFATPHATYIYGRYQLDEDPLSLQDTFFPVTYQS